jgi:hypothetical protein
MFKKLTLLTLTLAAVVGCGSNDDNDEARLRVFHASPDAPNVDVLVNGGSVLEDVPYTAASEFLPLTAGKSRITVTVAGTNTAVIDEQLDLGHNTDYLVVAAGKVAEIAPIVVTADRSAPPEGSARVRVLHTAASAPAVDVYVTAPGAGIRSAEPVLSNVPFRAISNYLTVPAGSYDVSVTVAGTKNIAIEALNLAISDGLVATVAALDSTGGGAPFALKVLDESKPYYRSELLSRLRG